MGAVRRKPTVGYLHGGKRRAVLTDLLGIIVRDLLDLQEPGCLRQRLQGLFGIAALKVLVLQPFFQVADVTSVLNHQQKCQVPPSKQVNVKDLERKSAPLVMKS